MKTRPFTFNIGTAISGTRQVGYIAAQTGVTLNNSPSSWYMGPDEDLGYVITSPYPTLIAKNVVSDGLILQLDAGNKNSYIGTGNVWNDISGSNAHATLLNNPTWNSSGYFTFDGISQGADGVNVSQNYVDIMIGMYSSGTTGTGLEMVFAKYNDQDVSFRTASGLYQHSGLNSNDLSFGSESNDNIDGSFITGNVNLVNSWHIVRFVTNTTSFVYSISSDFMSRRFKGNIAFVLCYNRILSTNEVQQNFNAYRNRFSL